MSLRFAPKAPELMAEEMNREPLKCQHLLPPEGQLLLESPTKGRALSQFGQQRSLFSYLKGLIF